MELLVARIEVPQTYAVYHFGQIRADLYERGLPIGPDDLVIAGYAVTLYAYINPWKRHALCTATR